MPSNRKGTKVARAERVLSREQKKVGRMSENSSLAKDGPKGIGLRDYFAGLALQGFTSVQIYYNNEFEDVAAWAYKMADAMLNERDKQKEEKNDE